MAILGYSYTTHIPLYTHNPYPITYIPWNESVASPKKKGKSENPSLRHRRFPGSLSRLLTASVSWCPYSPPGGGRRKTSWACGMFRLCSPKRIQGHGGCNMIQRSTFYLGLVDFVTANSVLKTRPKSHPPLQFWAHLGSKIDGLIPCDDPPGWNKIHHPALAGTAGTTPPAGQKPSGEPHTASQIEIRRGFVFKTAADTWTFSMKSLVLGVELPVFDAEQRSVDSQKKLDRCIACPVLETSIFRQPVQPNFQAQHWHLSATRVERLPCKPQYCCDPSSFPMKTWSTLAGKIWFFQLARLVYLQQNEIWFSQLQD